MRPTSSKHGLERKFKPWRKGKSSSKKNEDGVKGGGSKINRTKNASLKNLLRSQKRLLGRLEKGRNVENDGGNDVTNTDAIDGARERIKQLEQEISAHEGREREKKNASKYHQVKFIERQKLTRLEKSVRRQMKQILERQSKVNDDGPQSQLIQLEQQLQSIAMDQLYIAFFPTDRKYMALFTHGMSRVVDDERGRKRRQAVWNLIREGLLEDLKQNKNDGDDDNIICDGSDDESGSDSGNDSSSVPSSDEEEDTNDKHTNSAGSSTSRTPQKEMILGNAKAWVNLDDAKRALLSMPADTYPNSLHTDAAAIVSMDPQNDTKTVGSKKESNITNGKDVSNTATTSKKPQTAAVTTAHDSRFALSNELDMLFQHSTTGDDYQTELHFKEVDSIDSDNGGDSDSSLDDDEADPLSRYDSKKEVGVRSTSDKKRGDDSSSSSSSASSSEDSSDSESSDSVDSVSGAGPPSLSANKKTQVSNVQTEEPQAVDGGDGVDEQDDFFSTANAKVSAEDIFTQAQNKNDDVGKTHVDKYQTRNHRSSGDKSRGFNTQNQSKREYAAFQHRNKRRKFV